MTFSSRPKRLFALVLAVLFSASVVPLASGATIEWANVGATWSADANWVGGTAPADSTVTDIGAFGSTGGSAVNPNLTAGRSINSISFLSGAFAYTIDSSTGSALVIGASGITNSATNTETFGSGIILRTSTSQTWSNNGGSLVFNGLVDIVQGAASTRTLTVDGSGNTTFNGIIQNSGLGSTGNLIYGGAGTLTLAGANTYTGTTTLNSGTTLINGTQVLATGAVSVNGSGTVLGGIGTTGGSGTALRGTGTISGGTTLGGTGTIGGTVTLNGGSPNFRGTVILGFSTGGILNPGPQGTAGTAASVGTLTTGALTLTGANTVHIDAFGTLANQWDRLVSTGAIDLGETSILDVTIAPSLTFTAGSTYVLLNGTSLDGTFSGIADNDTVTFSGYSFTADYTTTGFNLLVPVPEPSTWIAGILTLAAIGYTQRRRFQKAFSFRS